MIHPVFITARLAEDARIEIMPPWQLFSSADGTSWDLVIQRPA